MANNVVCNIKTHGTDYRIQTDEVFGLCIYMFDSSLCRWKFLTYFKDESLYGDLSTQVNSFIREVAL